ncbi:MAG: HAMP domain-containing histidine kinase [Deltaproteobacteria bacterium]|nr:HAMP domain-containing histidine kinase [Deltaproteobacteria bacterium]
MQTRETMKNAFSWYPALWLLLSTVLLPTLGTLSVGILILVFYRESWDVAFGVLVLCFAFFAIIGSSITVFLLRRSDRLAHLQSDFIARMSHDFRTPLTSIKLFVDTLRANKIDADEARQCLDLLAQETERMEGLVEHVLNWRYVERKRVIGPKDVDPEELARLAIAPFTSPLDRASAERLELVVEINLPTLSVDREGIVEAIRNLVKNALEYTSGAVVIRVHRHDNLLSFSVTDKGPPIPRSERKQIFRRFYRAQTKQGGSGLGLAIAKHIARAHGGTLDLTVTDSGNTFAISLPLNSRTRRLARRQQETA